jgi:hypothetical protein
MPHTAAHHEDHNATQMITKIIIIGPTNIIQSGQSPRAASKARRHT